MPLLAPKDNDEDTIMILALSLDIIQHIASGIDPKVNSSGTSTQLAFGKPTDNSLLTALLTFSTFSHIPAVFRKLSLVILADTLLKHHHNQTVFMSCVIDIPKVHGINGSDLSNRTPKAELGLEKKSALLYILDMAINNPEQTFRSIALYVLRSYFTNNEDGQVSAASTFTPTLDFDEKSSSQPSSFGQILVDTLTRLIQRDSKLIFENNSSKFYRAWGAVRIITYILRDSKDCKQLLLNLPLEIPTSNASPVRLIDKCLVVLNSSNSDLSVQVVLLILICEWSFGCRECIDMLADHSLGLPSVVHLAQKSSEPLVNALASLIIAICLDYVITSQSNEKSEPHTLLRDGASPSVSKTHMSILYESIIEKIGVDKFNANINYLLTCQDAQETITGYASREFLYLDDAKKDEKFTQVFATQIFDEHIVAMVNAIHGILDKRLLVLCTSNQSIATVKPETNGEDKNLEVAGLQKRITELEKV